MNRRRFASLLAAASALPAAWMPAGTAAAQAPSPERLAEPLALYGVALRDAGAQAFLVAARAAGGVDLPLAEGAAPQLDMRGAGVPALQLSLTAASTQLVDPDAAQAPVPQLVFSGR